MPVLLAQSYICIVNTDLRWVNCVLQAFRCCSGFFCELYLDPNEKKAKKLNMLGLMSRTALYMNVIRLFFNDCVALSSNVLLEKSKLKRQCFRRNQKPWLDDTRRTTGIQKTARKTSGTFLFEENVSWHFSGAGQRPVAPKCMRPRDAPTTSSLCRVKRNVASCGKHKLTASVFLDEIGK